MQQQKRSASLQADTPSSYVHAIAFVVSPVKECRNFAPAIHFMEEKGVPLVLSGSQHDPAGIAAACMPCGAWGFKNLYSQVLNAVWAGLLPPCRVKKS